MTVLVTGATGFLGNNLVRQLLAQGIQPVCLKRPGPLHPALADLNLQWNDRGYGEPELLKSLLAEATVIYHCAAQVGTANKVSARFVRANVDLTRSLLKAAEGTTVRFVHCSTIATCAVSTDGQDVSEDSPWNFDRFGLANGYTQTKRIAEEMVLEAVAEGLDGVVVNPCFMLGPYDTKLSSCRLIVDVVRGRIPGFPPGALNFVDVRDVARGMLLAAQHGRRGERYILGGVNLDYREIFARISAITGSKPIDKPMTAWLGRLVATIGDLKENLLGGESLLNSTGIAMTFAQCRYSSAKAVDELGYQISDIDGAIRDAYGWFVRNNYL
jgi:dihydroflavonol-4-reductase